MKKPQTAVFLFCKNGENFLVFDLIYAFLCEKMREKHEKISFLKHFDFFRQSFYVFDNLCHSESVATAKKMRYNVDTNTQEVGYEKQKGEN